MLKLLWKIKWLRKHLRSSKRCRSLVEATGVRCEDFAIRGTPYCNTHHGKIPWFVGVLPVLLGWVLGLVTPPLKSKYFPSESEQTLRQLAHPKPPKIQFFVGDDGTPGFGQMIRVVVITIPLGTNFHTLNFALQNMGDTPIENFRAHLIFDERLSFTSSLKKTDAIRLDPAPAGYKHTMWLQGDMLIYKPDAGVLPLSFSPTNVLNTPMNLNFDVRAKGVEQFPVRLTLLFVPGTGAVTTTAFPESLLTNETFVISFQGITNN